MHWTGSYMREPGLVDRYLGMGLETQHGRVQTNTHGSSKILDSQDATAKGVDHRIAPVLLKPSNNRGTSLAVDPEILIGLFGPGHRDSAPANMSSQETTMAFASNPAREADSVQRPQSRPSLSPSRKRSSLQGFCLYDGDRRGLCHLDGHRGTIKVHPTDHDLT